MQSRKQDTITYTIPDVIPVVILAGGQSQRLQLNDQFKWQLPFTTNKTLLDFIIEKIKLQSNHILINAPSKANSNGLKITKELIQYQLPLIYDEAHTFRGPMSGLHSILKWAQNSNHPWVATIACDTPFFPDNLLDLLKDSINQSPNNPALAVSVSYKQRLQPIFGLWSNQLCDNLDKHLQQTENLSIGKWVREQARIIDIHPKEDDDKSIDPFFNINTYEDYAFALASINKTTE